jgi:hypothetical protein
MSNTVQVGRYRADFPEGTVVFMIGMRINALWRLRDWLPVFNAMPKMLAELSRNPQLGLLEARTEMGWRRFTVVQYWESMDKLMDYAASRNAEHLPAWKAFNQRARKSPGSVGIWHEAYTVDPQTSHIVYNSMPLFGMAKATTSAPEDELPPQPIPSRADL